MSLFSLEILYQSISDILLTSPSFPTLILHCLEKPKLFAIPVAYTEPWAFALLIPSP
jgi:hypothetical protein